jgi:TetR/AcrR family transcriptional repressor of nem operon
MARKKQFNPEAALKKAMLLFWEKGFYATSMQDLVDTLGINRASIYGTFENKSKLYELALDKYVELVRKRKADFLYQYINVRQGLYSLFEAEVELALSDEVNKGCFLINSISELSNSESDLNIKMVEYQNGMNQVYLNYLQYGVEQGQVSIYKDISTISACLSSFESGIKTLSKSKGIKEDCLKQSTLVIGVLD